MEQPLFGPSGKLPNVTREPRLPDAQPDQAEPQIPVEPKQSNVPEETNDSLLTKPDPVIETPETQQDELTPPVLEVEKKEQIIEESPTDSLKLEVAKDKKESKDLSPPAPEESQPETEQKIEEELDIRLTLADEKAMSQKNSPFRTVASLSDYILLLMKEGED